MNTLKIALLALITLTATNDRAAAQERVNAPSSAAAATPVARLVAPNTRELLDLRKTVRDASNSGSTLVRPGCWYEYRWVCTPYGCSYQYYWVCN